MNLGILWPKLAPALIVVVLFAAVYRVRPLRPLRIVGIIIALMLARDLLYLFVPRAAVYGLADLAVLTLYLVWLRASTERRRIDLFTVLLNVLVAAAAVANVVVPFFDDADFVLGLWLLVNVGWLAVQSGLVSTIGTERSEVVVRARAVLSAVLFIGELVALLWGYGDPLVQAVVVPLSYLAPAWLLISYNADDHREETQSIKFYSSNLDATYGFMENLGNAITAKIDLPQVLSIIITAAVKNIGADAGAILMVDEYEDILRVKATHGVFPPLAEVPELARVTPASLKRYFEETPIRIGETLLGETVKTGESIFIRDARQDERMAHNLADDIMFCSSAAAIPLVVRNRVLGVLAVLKRAENQFFDERDFGQLTTLAEYASITIDNLITYTEILEKRQTEREVDIAAQIQRKLQPARLPELATATLGVYNLPAKGVSGDYYDIFPLDRDLVGMVICDVAGKGIPAALVMVMIRSIVHLIVSADRDAAATLDWINRGITGRIDLDHFATVSFLIYDQRKREIQYANAAHLPLLVHRRRTGKTFKVDTEGLPIGVERKAHYQQKRFTLEKGDLAILCTDGILEAMNTAGTQYGLGGLRRVVEENAGLPAAELVSTIREDLQRFVGSARQHDDQTLLLLQAR